MVNKNRFCSYYAAKFARQEREHPTHWLIIPDGLNWFELKQIGGFDGGEK